MTTQCSDWNKIINFQKKSLGWEYSSVVESSGSTRPSYAIKKKKNQYLTLPVADESETCCLVHTSTGLLASSTESLPSPAGAHYLKLMPHLQPSLGAPETGIVRRKGQISTVGEFTIYVHFKRHFPEAADSDSLTFLFFVFF